MVAQDVRNSFQAIPVDQQMSILADKSSCIEHYTTMANGLRITGEFGDCHQRLMQKAEIIQRYCVGLQVRRTPTPDTIPLLEII